MMMEKHQADAHCNSWESDRKSGAQYYIYYKALSLEKIISFLHSSPMLFCEFRQLQITHREESTENFNQLCVMNTSLM
jgi:hypothetical protein